MTTTIASRLAINGGTPVRTAPWPARGNFGPEEKQAAMALFDKAIETGGGIGYNGEEEEAFGREFAEFHGTPVGLADGVNSGSSAVYVALRALDLPPFSEVIVPPISDPGGVMPVPLIGCIPVPADAVPGSYNMGPEQIEARLSPRTSAILVAHISGHAADMAPIMEIARSRGRGLPVIEDCAQAPGATYRGQLVGTFGDIAAFSTMFGKHLCTGPQGGVVYTRREDLYWASRRASDRGKPFGLPPGSDNAVASLNLNSNELAAAIGRAQLRKLPGIIAARRRTAAALAEGCRNLKAVRVNTGLPNTQGVYWFGLLRVDFAKLAVDKATFAKAVQAEGIPLGTTYYHAPTQQTWAKQRRVLGASGWPWTAPQYEGDPDAQYALPNARATDDAHVTLPLHERVGEQEVRDTLAALKKVEAAYGR